MDKATSCDKISARNASRRPISIRHLLVVVALENSHAPFNALYQSEHEDWIQAMIPAGLGCACMPEFTPLFPELRTRLLVEPEVSREIAVIVKRGRRHTPTVDLFVRLCRTMNWAAQLPG